MRLSAIRLAQPARAAPGVTLLRLIYIDAVETGPRGWRLLLSFDVPRDLPARGGAPPAVSPTDIAIAYDDGRMLAPLDIVDLHWDVPFFILAVDVAGRRADWPATPGISDNYLLRLVPGTAFDPAYCSAAFRLPGPFVAPTAGWDGRIDYLAKDYDAFRRLLLETATRLAPQWQDRSEADLGVTIAEVLAYAADFLSYYQDAVGTEAYPDTARRRRSTRRHLRLIDYRLSDGCAARTLVSVRVREPWNGPLTPGTQFASGSGGAVVDTGSLEYTSLAAGDTVFYTALHNASLFPVFNRQAIFDFGIEDYRLRAGACSLTLVVPPDTRELFSAHAPGRVFAITGRRWRGGPEVAHPVRVTAVTIEPGTAPSGAVLIGVRWHIEDALPWDLPVRDRFDAVAGAVLVGNLVLAEAGRCVFDERLGEVPADETYVPRLAERNVVAAAPFVDGAEVSAAALLRPAVERAVPVVSLRQALPLPDRGGFGLPGHQTWRAVPDLLNSASAAPHFVAEADSDGVTVLRFGDGDFGRKPAAGTVFFADYRVGPLDGAPIGRGMLDTLVLRLDRVPPRIAAALRRAVIGIANIVPSMGGAPPEAADAATRRARELYRTVQSCVTLADYVAAAEAVAGVAEAVASLESTGLGEVVVVHVRAAEQLYIGEAFLNRVRDALRPRLLAGRRLVVMGPRLVSIRLGLRVTIATGFPQAAIRRDLNRAMAGEGSGLFAPDRIGFGRPVFAGTAVAAIMAIDGVAAATVTRLERRLRPTSAVPAMLSLDEDELPVVEASFELVEAP